MIAGIRSEWPMMLDLMMPHLRMASAAARGGCAWLLGTTGGSAGRLVGRLPDRLLGCWAPCSLLASRSSVSVKLCNPGTGAQLMQLLGTAECRQCRSAERINAPERSLQSLLGRQAAGTSHATPAVHQAQVKQPCTCFDNSAASHGR